MTKTEDSYLHSEAGDYRKMIAGFFSRNVPKSERVKGDFSSP